MDSITAIKEIVQQFNSQWIPFLVVNFVILPEYTWYIALIQWINLISAVIASILVFLHWKKGPKWWTNAAPKIYLVSLILMYIVFPLLCIISAVYGMIVLA